MSHRPTVLVDMDGIMVDLLPRWLEWLNHEHELDVGVDDIITWNIGDSPKLSHLTKEQVCAPMDDLGFFSYASPIPGMADGMKRLDEFCDLFVCSSPANANCAKEKMNWLKQHLPWFSRKKIILAHEKYMIPGDFLIDDSPENLKKHVDRWHSRGVTIKYPYNEKLIDDATTWIAGHYPHTEEAWDEIVNYVGSFI